jgi:hypothetical protein
VTDRRRSDKHQTSTWDEVLKSQLRTDCDWNQSPVIDSINQTSPKIASIKKALEICLGVRTTAHHASPGSGSFTLTSLWRNCTSTWAPPSVDLTLCSVHKHIMSPHTLIAPPKSITLQLESRVTSAQVHIPKGSTLFFNSHAILPQQTPKLS